MKPTLHLNVFIPVAIFILAVLIRISLFVLFYSNERHNYAEFYGSAAIGLSHGKGLTYNFEEVSKIEETKNTDFTQNFNDFTSFKERHKWLYGLSGPVYAIYLLWVITHIYNFFPYIILQILLDSIMITFLYIVAKKYLSRLVVYVLLFSLLFNPAAISDTLCVSYNFWAPLSVMIGFFGFLYAFSVEKNNHIFFLTGLFTAITLWFRDIINFLPFFLAFAIVFYYVFKKKTNPRKIFNKFVMYLLPVLISISLLSINRYQNTGSFRPTQTFFWHAFFAAVGQFDNPYGIKDKDEVIWAFGSKLNPEIKMDDQFKYSENTSNIYEETLKKEGFKFIKEHPFIFIRNMIYRTGIMIAPTFFIVSGQYFSWIFNDIVAIFISIILLILWILGLYHLFKTKSPLLYVIIPVYLYFFSIFSWYYLVGRVVLCFAFINIILYMYGLMCIYNLYLIPTITRKANRV